MIRSSGSSSRQATPARGVARETGRKVEDLLESYRKIKNSQRKIHRIEEEAQMPMGELRCSARMTREEVDVLIDEFRLEGKADKSINLKVLDSSGKMVADAQATFRLMATPDMFKERFAAMLGPSS